MELPNGVALGRVKSLYGDGFKYYTHDGKTGCKDSCQDEEKWCFLCEIGMGDITPLINAIAWHLNKPDCHDLNKNVDMKFIFNRR